MKLKMIVFDMAGTVVDEDNVVYKTLQASINDEGYNFTLDQVLETGAGKEKLQATRDVLKLEPKRFTEELAKHIYANFVPRLADAYAAFPVKAQPGAESLFRELQKRKIIVVLNTGYNRETAQSLLKKLTWHEGQEIDGLVTATDTQRNRPEPDMIDFAMKRFGVTDPSAVAKVGDSIIDIEEGRNAGCGLCIGITTGAHTRKQLHSAQPDFIIDHLSELLPLLD